MRRSDEQLLDIIYQRSAALRRRRRLVSGMCVAVVLAAVAVAVPSGTSPLTEDLDTVDVPTSPTAPAPPPGADEDTAGIVISGGSSSSDALPTTASDEAAAPGSPTSVTPPAATTGDDTSAAPDATTGDDTPAAPDAPAVVTRTAPYDYGCELEVPCGLENEEARNGNIRSAPYAEPCYYYGPPFANVCPANASSYAGVRIEDAGTRRWLEASAVVRRESSTVVGVSACLTLIEQSTGYGYYSLGCQPLADDGSVTIGESFEITNMSTPIGLYVSLEGEGAAVVDSISYSYR